MFNLKKDKKFDCVDSESDGRPIILLYGLMGSFDDFDVVFTHLSKKKKYRVILPYLPIYSLPLIRTNVKNIATFVKSFMEYKNISSATLVGNSLGGHVALYIAKKFPELIDALVLTGSSGLYEKSMGDSYPKRGDYEYIKMKIQAVFYDPKVARKKMVDRVFSLVNDRNCVIRILSLAKSAIRHNMAKDLPGIKIPTCIIWGKQDDVTPAEIAEKFHALMPNSQLFWIDKCGHAPMMECPEKFNEILESWFEENKLN